MLTGNPNGLVERAYVFGDKAHRDVGQLRKYTQEPYFTHPIAVAGLVATVNHTPIMLAASLLHDTVEDTNTSIEEIETHFGVEVATLVGWLTDVSKPEDGNRKARKLIDRNHIAQAPAEAQTIKLADLIDNSKSILAHDPKFAAVYLVEKKAALEVLTKGDPKLWLLANDILQAGLKELVGTTKS